MAACDVSGGKFNFKNLVRSTTAVCFALALLIFWVYPTLNINMQNPTQFNFIIDTRL